MKKTVKRSIALVLSLIMLFSCIGVSAATEETTGYEALRITCVMNGDAKSQRGFTWFTEKACDSALQVVTNAEYILGGFKNAVTTVGDTATWDGYYSHKVLATGLKAGTTYKYRVGSLDMNVWSSVGTFKTDDGDGKFSFIAIADVQASSLENFQHAAVVMDKAMQYTPNAEFAVNLGDFVNDCTSEEWNWYGEAFKKANTSLTLVPVAGNHDGNITNKLNVGWFNNMFNLDAADAGINGVNGTFYSFDYGNTHFTVLNSNDMYPMTQAQRNWIINDLTASNAHWKVLLLHRGPYSAGKNINKPDTIIMRETVIDIVDQTGVDLVLSGHDHVYYRSLPAKGDALSEDVTYVTEKFNGKDTTFAVNPDGAIYALPSTAGTKRYAVNENAIAPTLDIADKCFTTRNEVNDQGVQTNANAGGCFSNIEVNGTKLVYKAYVVDDTTKKVKLVDEYAIKKTEKAESDGATNLPTDVIGTLDGSVMNLFTELIGMIVTYIGKLLPQFVGGLF